MLKWVVLLILRSSVSGVIAWFAYSMLHEMYSQAASVTLPGWFQPLGEHLLLGMSVVILVVLPGRQLFSIVLRSLAVVLIWSLPIFALEMGLVPGSDRLDQSLATTYSGLMLALGAALIIEEIAAIARRRQDPRMQPFSMAVHDHLRHQKP